MAVEKVEKVKRELNKLTLKANLNFNVNTFKSWMKQKLKDDNKLFEQKKEDGTVVMCLPKFSGSQVALTAMNEKLCYIILEKVIEHLNKDKTGLYKIKYEDLSNAIKVDGTLRKNLYCYMDVYDDTLNYKDQYCIDEKCIKKYIDKVFSASIDISNDAFNFLVYLLLKACVRIIDTAFIMIKFAKRRSLNPNAIIDSVSVHFTGTIEHLLRMRIDEAMKSCGKEVDEKDPEEKDEDGIKEIEEDDVEVKEGVEVKDENEVVEEDDEVEEVVVKEVAKEKPTNSKKGKGKKHASKK